MLIMSSVLVVSPPHPKAISTLDGDGAMSDCVTLQIKKIERGGGFTFVYQTVIEVFYS